MDRTKQPALKSDCFAPAGLAMTKWSMKYSHKFLLLIFFLLTPPLHAALDSNTARQAFEQGLAAKNENRLNEAEHYFKKALEEEASNADYHFELATVFALQENLIAASRELEQAVMIRPDFVAGHFNLGVVYKKRGKFEEARAQFKKAMTLTPPGQSVTPFLMQIASIYEEQGFYDDAESLYKEALEKDYGNAEPRNALETLNERRQASVTQERRSQMAELQNQLMNPRANSKAPRSQ